MKLNFNTLKVLLALVIIIGALLWSENSIRNLSYSGTDLSFPVGQGVVTVTNPSAEAVPVQLIGTGTRAFSVLSKVEGIAGPAVKQGSGSTGTYLRDFALLPGINEFTITRGTNVNFVAVATSKLDAIVQPLDAGSTRTLLIVTGIVILAMLYFIARTTGYSLNRIFHLQDAPVPILQPVVENAAVNQGRAAKSYGDNRADRSQ